MASTSSSAALPRVVTVAAPQNGTNVVEDFHPAAGDVISLVDLGFSSFEAFGAALSAAGGDTVVAAPGGGSIVLRSVAPSSLSKANVVFDLSPAYSDNATNWARLADASKPLKGGAGNDALAASGTGTLDGGAGDDTYVVNSQSILVVERGGQGTDTVASYARSYTLASDQSVEDLKLLAAADASGFGNDLDNVIVGNAWRNVIGGGRGDDVLTGGRGADTFVVRQGGGLDVVTDFEAKGTGADTIRLEGFAYGSFAALAPAMKQVGADVAIWLGTSDTLTLKNVSLTDLSAANFTFADVAAAPAPEAPTPSPSVPTPPASVQPGVASAVASGAPTKWLKTGTASTLVGSSGNDQLTASAAGARLVGGKGDDTYIVGAMNVTLVEAAGEGFDTVNVYTTNGEGYALPDNLENVTLKSLHDDWLAGNAASNIVVGNAKNNQINARGGNDIVTGGGGHDVIVVAKGEGSDTITDFGTTASTSDVIRLDGFAFRSFAEIKAVASQAGADTVLALGGGQTLTLKGVSFSSLTADNFALPIDKTGFLRTFNDDFDSFSREVNGAGTWQTKYIYGGDGAYGVGRPGGEIQAYVDPSFKGLTGSQATAPLGLDPFSVANGQLTITAQQASAAAKPYLGKQTYTSGIITTHSSFLQTYGYFEMKADVPDVKGAWPAFWMLRADSVTPTELDVMEGLGDRKNTVHHAVHAADETQEKGDWAMADALGAGTHTFGVKWTPYEVTFYVDGRETLTYATPDDMNAPMYLIANLAMGGSWAGDPKGASAQFKIDSITAWQLPEYTLANYTLKTSAAPTRWINGTGAAETLTGSDAAERLVGNGGADTLKGGAGDDTYVVSAAGTRIVEATGEGVDTVLSSVSYTLAKGVENLTLTGTAAISATGNDGANIVIGNGSANVIRGGLGNDVLTGGGGNDTFVIAKGDGSDVITDFTTGAGASHDVVDLDGFAFTSFADVRAAMTQQGADVHLRLSHLETLVFRDTTLAGFTADDFALPKELPISDGPMRWVLGTGANETLYGTDAREELDGRGGVDTLVGGDGDDTYVANASTRIVEKAGGGVDTVEAWTAFTLPDQVENLVMKQANAGTGNVLANRITGSAGVDTLNGKGGADWLYGGAGNDTFVFEKGSGRDTIADFHSQLGGGGERDVIEFRGFGQGAYLSHQGDVWTVHSAGGTDSLTIAGITNLHQKDYVFV